jgi:hypothetical protein
MQTSTLKPGLLVSLKTSVRGGVNYQRRDTDPEHKDQSGALVATWETTREIQDPAEFERATVARGKARSLITSVCCASEFGLLCPQADEAELQAAIEAAREVARTHNAGAARTQVDVFVIVGRVAQNDVEAARAIGAELRELLDAMKGGIAAADPEVIRDAATRARNLAAMLSADVVGQVSAAILEARTAAREIAKRVQRAGEQAAQVVAECSVQRIDTARFAFLDLDEHQTQSEPAPARGVDLEAAAAVRADANPTRALEF